MVSDTPSAKRDRDQIIEILTSPLGVEIFRFCVKHARYQVESESGCHMLAEDIALMAAYINDFANRERGLGLK